MKTILQSTSTGSFLEDAIRWPKLQQHVSNWPESRFSERYDELMQDMKFDNSLGGSASLLTLMISEGNGVLERTRCIISMIDAEIGTEENTSP